MNNRKGNQCWGLRWKESWSSLTAKVSWRTLSDLQWWFNSSSLGLTRKESRVSVGLDLLIHHPRSQCLGAEDPRVSSLPEVSLCLVLPALISSVGMVPQGHQLALVISSCLSGCCSHFPGSPTPFFISDHSLCQLPGRNRTKDAQGSSLLSSQLGDLKLSRTLGWGEGSCSTCLP